MADGRIATYAATQSVAEIGLGSVVHALHIPFGGHLLSLNQGLILVLATKGSSSRKEAFSTTSGIANVAALLKALSPAGARLTPMFAIAMQGFLFSLGIGVLGPNRFGAMLGMLLLSVWGFAQPLLFAYLLFGKTLFQGLEKLWTEAAQNLGIPPEAGLWIIAGIVGVKLVLACAVALGGWMAGERFEEKYLGKVESLRARLGARRPISSSASGAASGPGSDAALAPGTPSRQGAVRGAFQDLLNPWFLVSLIVSVGFLVLSQHPGGARVLLYLLRTLALAWLFFWALRAVPASWTQRVLQRFPHLEGAVAQVFRSRSRS